MKFVNEVQEIDKALHKMTEVSLKCNEIQGFMKDFEEFIENKSEPSGWSDWFWGTNKAARETLPKDLETYIDARAILNRRPQKNLDQNSLEGKLELKLSQLIELLATEYMQKVSDLLDKRITSEEKLQLQLFHDKLIKTLPWISDKLSKKISALIIRGKFELDPELKELLAQPKLSEEERKRLTETLRVSPESREERQNKVTDDNSGL